MTGTQTAVKWLGDGNPFSERFPACDLNEGQVRTLIGFSDILVNNLGPSPAIRKLTDSGIVEVSVNWAKHPKDFGSAGKLWMEGDGSYIAAAIWEGQGSSDRGPIRVYRCMPKPPGQRWRPFGEKAEEIVYPESSHRMGSTLATRAFIKEHYMGDAC